MSHHRVLHDTSTTPQLHACIYISVPGYDFRSNIRFQSLDTMPEPRMFYLQRTCCMPYIMFYGHTRPPDATPPESRAPISDLGQVNHKKVRCPIIDSWMILLHTLSFGDPLYRVIDFGSESVLPLRAGEFNQMG